MIDIADRIIPEQLFGYTTHALMIPPIPVQTALILGYGNGVVDHLMQKVWGGTIKVTGVDKIIPKNIESDALLVEMDANRYLQGCDHQYDFTVIDLYDGDVIPEFVFTDEFVSLVRAATKKMLAINATVHRWNDFKMYDKYFTVDAVKQVNADKVLFMTVK